MVMVPPASETSRSVPLSTTPVLNSFVGSASASSTREDRSVVIVPPASVTSRSVPLSTTPVVNSFVGSASASSTREDRSIDAEAPPSIYTVATVPARLIESRF